MGKLNKNVSTSETTRSQRLLISELKVIVGLRERPGGKIRKRSISCSNSSFAWKYFGNLHHLPADAANVPSFEVSDKLMFCRYTALLWHGIMTVVDLLVTTTTINKNIRKYYTR